MSSKFFNHDSELEILDLKNDEKNKKPNYFTKFKSGLLNVMKLVAAILVLNSYLSILGLEQS